MFIIFWALLALVYGFFWLLFLVIFIIGRKLKSSPLTWFSAVPLALSTGLGLFIVGLTTYNFVSISNPATVYKLTFDTLPPSDVTHLQSNYDGFGDYSVTYLKFESSPETIKKLIGKGWTRLTPRQIAFKDVAHFQSDQPSWWHPIASKSLLVYIPKHRQHNFSVEEETLTYDTATKQAHYAYSGID